MLKKIRVSIACVIMAFFAFLFWGWESAAPALSTPLLFFQVTPSLVKFILAAGGMAALGFALMLLLTILFGRVYCACICPLGILQDILPALVAGKTGRKRQYAYHQPYPVIRYGMFGLTIFTALLGTFAALNLVDPYSFFGRIVVHLFKPLLVAANNLAATLLESFEVYLLPTLSSPPVAYPVLLSTLILFYILTRMAIYRGRLFCNLLCPVGALLGLFSRFSLYKVTIQAEHCIACQRCEKACKAECIETSQKSIDHSRCVACFNCLESCPTSAIAYAWLPAKPAPTAIDPERRRWLIRLASAAGALILSGLPLRFLLNLCIFRTNGPFAAFLSSTEKTLPVVPPGALGLDNFTAKCTACHLCVSVCPTHVLQPAPFDYGLRGVLQPTMNFRQGPCTYECNLCGRVCPTGAIQALALAEKKRTQIGIVQLDKDRCIVHTRKEDCGACAEVCPTHAVYTVAKEHVHYPETKDAPCIGCGACENVCPTTPKSIVVEANLVHQIAEEPYFAEEPPVEKIPQQKEEDFPF